MPTDLVICSAGEAEIHAIDLLCRIDSATAGYASRPPRHRRSLRTLERRIGAGRRNGSFPRMRPDASTTREVLVSGDRGDTHDANRAYVSTSC